MPSRNITNLILAIALAGLVIFIYLETRDSPDQDISRLTSLKADDIHDLTISNTREENIILQKSDGQWRLVQPFSALANNTRIAKLLSIVGAKSEAQYHLTDTELGQLRLINPDISLRVDQLLLEIGTTEPLQQHRYVKVGDTIHLIVDSYTYLAQGGASDFVDNQLLAGTNRITALSLPDLNLKKTEQGWEAIGHTPQPSADLIQQFIDDWQQARALKVTRNTSDTPTPNIHIEFTGAEAPVSFALSRVNDEIILLQPDNGLEYHFSLSNGERLLSLPVSVNATPE